MHKKAVVLLVSFVVMALIICGAMNMFFRLRNEKTFFYKKDEGVYTNPYIGFAPDCGSYELCQNSSLVYLNLLWAELEPLEGVFDWDTIEEENHFDEYRQAGKHLVLRFVCDYPTGEEHMDIPKWLYDKTKDGEFYNIEYGCGYCPDYNNEVFIQEHNKVIDEIGRHFSEDNFLAYVELGSLGHWGEWHTYYPAGIPKMPLTDIRSIYVGHYVDAFPYARLLMRRPFAEMPEDFGLFNDMTGAEEDTAVWLDWIEHGGKFSETKEANGIRSAENVWDKAPVGGEFTSSIPMNTMLGSDLEKTISLIQKSHMSFIGPKVPENSRGDETVMKNQGKVLNTLGYRYRVSSLAIKKVSRSETQLTVTITNDGVAPIYFDFIPCIYIERSDGTQIARYELDIDLKKLCQNQERRSVINVSSDLLKESGIRIYGGIEESGSSLPSVYLTMEAQREGTKSLLWSNRE